MQSFCICRLRFFAEPFLYAKTRVDDHYEDSLLSNSNHESEELDLKLTIKKITTLAMLAALAYVLMAICRIPFMPQASFLEYDPKDIFFVIAGFLIGPWEGLIIIVLVCLIEMVTVSTSGPIGLLMNVIASVCFVLPACLIYRKKKNLPLAIVGLSAGVLCMTTSMILWNWIITPIYTGMPREAVVPMLPTVFLPFNLIKAGINMALTLIIYKPISLILHKTGLVEERARKEGEAESESKVKKFSPLAIIVGIFLLAICIGAILIIRGN
ncbi:MAG: ECF transporter S component [Lachnospiraceae bacterium]|nr:ECF transporter S component [Lachnospiraceae bacterium]